LNFQGLNLHPRLSEKGKSKKRGLKGKGGLLKMILWKEALPSNSPHFLAGSEEGI
jgi:hypothetical protein